MPVALRIRHGAVDPSSIVGRELVVDGRTLGRLTADEEDSYPIGVGHHIVWLRRGMHNSEAARFSVGIGQDGYVDLVVRESDPGLWGLFWGGYFALGRGRAGAEAGDTHRTHVDEAQEARDGHIDQAGVPA